MSKHDAIDQIIEQLTPEQVPSEFIVMAKVKTYDGMEQIVSGADLESLLESEGDNVENVKVILDVRAVRTAIITESNRIMAEAFSI